jgi:hypothetical protein
MVLAQGRGNMTIPIMNHIDPHEDDLWLDPVPDLAERLKTLERVTKAVTRARELLDQVNEMERQREARSQARLRQEQAQLPDDGVAGGSEGPAGPGMQNG